MSFNDPHDPPQGQPECGGSCGQSLTKWVWDEESEEWYAGYCETCQKRVLAKAEAFTAQLSSSGKLTPAQSERFVELILEQDTMLKTVIVLPFHPRNWWDVLAWFRYWIAHCRAWFKKTFHRRP